MKIEPIVLEGEHVRLEPLSMDHHDGLCRAISDGELWNLFVTLVPPPAEVESFIRTAERAVERGDGVAFATVDRKSNQIAGSTRFMKADLPNQRIEIGFTFLGRTWQKSAINTEAKMLMLSHAFEKWDMNRVEFLTDYLNINSRRAILRLGAKEEGLLRSHMVMPDCRVRDSVLFSIVKAEWPGVRQNLAQKLT